MKNKLTTICKKLLVGLLLAACGQSQSEKDIISSTTESTNVAKTEENFKSIELIIGDNIVTKSQDSINKIFVEKQRKENKLAISFAEKDFFKSLKGVDKDFSENNYFQMQKILKKHNKSLYDLYIELTEIFKKSIYEAKQTAINGGMKERKYTDFIGKIKDKYISQFQLKYGMGDRLYICFKNNYCSCYGENSDMYCSTRQPQFPNAEFWN